MFNTYKIKYDCDVDVKQTLFSGQSFLWDYHDYDFEYYSAVIDSNPVIIRQSSLSEFDVYSTSTIAYGHRLSDFIQHYFSLDIDSEKIFPESFGQLYPELWQLLAEYLPVKILRQDPFETIISFMCAQGIGMHLIRKQVSMLREVYGKKSVVPFQGREIIFHHFPSPEQLAAATPITLSRCTNNNRIRAGNIIQVARGVMEGAIDLDFLSNPDIPLAELRNMLCQNGGIGYKIADCIALFGLGRFDAFPIDTHVKQYLGEWFNSTTAHRSLTPANYLALDAEARTFLNSDLAGYAGHILFHCWRKEIKRLRTY